MFCSLQHASCCSHVWFCVTEESMPLLLSVIIYVIKESMTGSAFRSLRVWCGRYALSCSPVWFGVTKREYAFAVLCVFMCHQGGYDIFCSPWPSCVVWKVCFALLSCVVWCDPREYVFVALCVFVCHRGEYDMFCFPWRSYGDMITGSSNSAELQFSQLFGALLGVALYLNDYLRELLATEMPSKQQRGGVLKQCSIYPRSELAWRNIPRVLRKCDTHNFPREIS